MQRLFWTGILLSSMAVSLTAAPQLQLAQTALPVIAVGQGANGSVSVDAQNTGSGSLSLQVSSSASFLSPTVGAAHACTSGNGQSCLPIQIAINSSSLAAGLYVGVLTVYDPNAVNAPETITVPVQVGPSGVPAQITFWVPTGSALSADFKSHLATVNTGSGASWLSAAQDGGSPFDIVLPYKVTANSAGLAQGAYTGTVSVSGSQTAADNKTINVTLNVTAAAISGPLSSTGGAVNNATFAANESLSQGDIVALFGSQFTTASPGGATSLPLGTTLGGVQVLLNGNAVPIFYESAGQINFQVPYDATIGAGTLQVVSNGTNGNTIAVTIAKAEPRILQSVQTYMGNPIPFGLITNADNSLPWPTSLGGTPAKIGGTVVIYAIGFGPSSQTVASGAASPSTAPLALATDSPQVCFNPPTPFDTKGVCVTPSFAGLAPGFVGLYQINAQIPSASPTGDMVPVTIQATDGTTNTVYISVTH